MEANLAALEEEISILKGEIKSILQEVRMALLASENPFAGGSTPRVPQPAAAVDPSPEPKVVQIGAAPPAAPAAVTQSPDSAPPFQAYAEDAGSQATPPSGPAAAQDGGWSDGAGVSGQTQAPRLVALPGRTEATSGRRLHLASEPSRRTDIRTLSALLSWVEETRERLDERRYKVVVGLAKYGGLLDLELRETLLDAGKTMGGSQNPDRASVSDCIVALRQLEAILAEDARPSLLQECCRNDG